MKNTIVLSLSIVSLALLISGFISGPAKRGHDKTGSPLSNGTCMNCHSSGSFSPIMQIKVFDGDVEVDKYDPGKLYTLKYELMNSGSPSAFGFQTLVLNADNENTGTFGNIPGGFQQINLNNANYVEHSSPRSQSFFEIDWTAPADGEDVISIYAGGVAANSNNSTGGDGADTTIIQLYPNTSNTDDHLRATESIFSLKSNRVQNFLETQVNNNDAAVHYVIYNQQGQLIKNIKSSKQDLSKIIDISDLERGIYFINASQQGISKTEKFIKL